MEHGEIQLAGGSGQPAAGRTQGSEAGGLRSDHRGQRTAFQFRIWDFGLRISKHFTAFTTSTISTI